MISVYRKIFEKPQRFKPRQSLPLILKFLSDFMKCPVLEEEIEYSKAGKPSLKNSAVSFSVSHSGPFLAFACSRKCQVGLDIQTPMATSEKVIDLTVTKNEKAQKQWLENEVQFMDAWCIKEASLKLLGEGLSRPMDVLEVDFAAQSVMVKPFGKKDEMPMILKYQKLDLFQDAISYLVCDIDLKPSDVTVIS